jgi:hypothetical protein
VARRLHLDQRAVRHLAVHVIAHYGWRDHIVETLQYQRRPGQQRQIDPVVAEEGDARELLGDFRVGAAEAVVELVRQFRLVGLVHDHRRHAG